MRRIALWVIFSCLFACSGVPRPDTDLWVINAPEKHKKGYNLRRDYDDDGNLLPSAKPAIVPLSSIDDLNKYVCTDSEKSFPNLQVFIGLLRQRMNELQDQLTACRAGQR